MINISMTIKTKNTGFTIIELVVTIIVLSILIISITSLLINIEKSQHSSLLLESASRSGEQEIESLRNNNYTSLTPGSSIDFTNELPAVLPSPKSGIASISQPVDGLRRVDVTITYTDGTRTKTVALSSLIGQIGIGQ